MDVVAYLAHKGYGTPDEIMDTYTADEMVEFYSRSSQLYARELADALIVSRHAQHADKKGMEKLLKDLQKRMDGNKEQFMSADELVSGFEKFMNE